jgi:hypothetical protein
VHIVPILRYYAIVDDSTLDYRADARVRGRSKLFSEALFEGALKYYLTVHVSSQV